MYCEVLPRYWGYLIFETTFSSVSTYCKHYYIGKCVYGILNTVLQNRHCLWQIKYLPLQANVKPNTRPTLTLIKHFSSSPSCTLAVTLVGWSLFLVTLNISSTLKILIQCQKLFIVGHVWSYIFYILLFHLSLIHI